MASCNCHPDGWVSVQLDLRRLTFLSFELYYPRLSRFDQHFAEYLPRAREYHPFQHWHIDGESGVVEEEGRRLEIDGGALRYQETMSKAFDTTISDIGNLMTMTLFHFEIEVFTVSEAMLRQRWPVPSNVGSVLDVMKENALKLDESHFEPLGEISNAGLHLVGNHGFSDEDEDEDEDFNEPGSFHWHLEVDPAWKASNELFIELRTHFRVPLLDADGLVKALKLSYGFLDDNVGKFVTGFMP